MISKKKSKKEEKEKQRKRIMYMSDNIYLSAKQQVADDNILILPAYKKLKEEKTDTIVTTMFIR